MPDDIDRAEELAKTNRTALLLWLAAFGARIVWDFRNATYRTKNGVVGWSTVRRAVESVRGEARNRILRLSGALKTEHISISEWHLLAENQIRAMHTLSAGLAGGGKAQLNVIELSRLAEQTRREYAYLQAFSMQLRSGEQKLDGKFLQRAEMYINASRKTFNEVERRVHENADFNEEKNILSPAEHCAGCADEASQGWVPIGTLSEPGDRQCLSNCQCELIFRRAA